MFEIFATLVKVTFLLESKTAALWPCHNFYVTFILTAMNDEQLEL
jgi:hypothetical protein